MSAPIRVCSFESRRDGDMQRLIEKFGGLATLAPSMQELPLTSNDEAYTFGEQLIAGDVDIVIFMTGVGTKALFETLETKFSIDQIKQCLQQCLIVARGPKPVAALSNFEVKTNIKAPEPNTWHELVSSIVEENIELAGKRVAIQEYGLPSLELYEWLKARGAEVIPVPIYRWALPDDIGPLEAAIKATIAGEFDLLMWTSAQQLNHVLQVASQMNLKEDWLKAANQCFIASIGPTASERLIELKLPADFEPSHPKMAHLVRESLERYTEMKRVNKT